MKQYLSSNYVLTLYLCIVAFLAFVPTETLAQTQTRTLTCVGTSTSSTGQQNLSQGNQTDIITIPFAPEGAIIRSSVARRNNPPTSNPRRQNAAGHRVTISGPSTLSAGGYTTDINRSNARTSRTYTVTSGGRTVFTYFLRGSAAPRRGGSITTCTPPQEIEIQSSVNGAIADGGSDPQGTLLAGTSRTVTYTVRNAGAQILTLSGTPTAANLVNVDAGISVTAPGVLSIAPGATTTFQVTYTPTGAGPFSFDLDILSNDRDEATYDIAVPGNGNAAPTVVLTGPTEPQSGPFTVTATFSEPVSGLDISEFVVGNGTASSLVMVSPGVYTIVVTPTTPGVPVSVSLPANVAMDADSVMNLASNVLSVDGGALTETEREELRDIVVEQEIRNLRTQIGANQRAVKSARDRYLSAQRCRTLIDQEAAGRTGDPELEAECRRDEVTRGNTPLSFDTSLQATQSNTNLAGSFFGQTGSFDGERRRLVFGEFDVTRFEGGDVTVSFDGRVAWERLVGNDVLLGYFIGANAAYTDLEGNFSGNHLSYGLSAGAYFVDELSENLFWDGFLVIGYGRNELDLGSGIVGADSDYDTRSIQFGLALSGIKEYSMFELRPELSAAVGYSDIGDIALGLTTGTSNLADAIAAGNVTLATVSFTPEFIFPVNVTSQAFDESDFSVAPSLTCEYIDTSTSTTDCGGGVELEWSAKSNDGLREFSARIEREVISGNIRDRFGLEFRSEF